MIGPLASRAEDAAPPVLPVEEETNSRRERWMRRLRGLTRRQIVIGAAATMKWRGT